MAEYGVSMNDTLAMIAGSNTTLQNPEKVGNGLKTIAINLAGMKVNAKEGTLELNKTAKALNEIAGINVYSNESKGEVKDMMAILDELRGVWGKLRQDEQLALSEGIAGKQQAAVFQSLMSNFDIVKKAQSELNNGWHFGSALAENEQYINSIAGKLNTLKETWVGVFNTLFSSDAFKGIIDVLIAISESIAKVITALDEVGLLTPALMGLGTLLASKVFTGLPNLFRNTTSEARGLSGVIPRVAEGMGAFGLAGTRVGTSLLGASEGVTGFMAGVTPFIPWAIGAAGATMAVVAAYDYFTESLDEEKQRLNESITSRQEEIKSLDETKGKLQGIQEEYDKLSNKPKKTSEEVERLVELTNQLAEIKPELIVGYDENGNAIINMTGDVKDLIDELDRATQSKQRLLDVEKGDLAENSIKQLHGNVSLDDTSIKGMSSKANSEMGKLETLTTQHIDKMSKLEKKRDDLVNKLYGTTGKDRQKILKDIEKANYNIESQQSKFVQEYQGQLDVIKEYSDKIGEGLFTNLENGSIFGNASKEKQEHFLDLKNVLDFSDIQTEDQLLDVEMSLSRLLKVANDGKIDLKGLENSITDINKEFTRTNDFDKYEESMSNLAKSISEVTGVDVDILKDLFVGIDTSITQSKDSLDNFLKSFGKTKGDLLNGDAFAQALANQHRVIQSAIDDLNNITGDNEIDIELAYNIVNNKELPTELRDMVRILINKGFDVGDILEISQKVLIDLEDGEVDINNIQSMLDNAFGKDSFNISPKLLLTPEAELAAVDDIVNRLKEKYGEIPSEIETSIRVDSITSYIEAERILSLYNNFPDEVKTVISNNGYDTITQLGLINELFLNLPKEQAMNIITNYSEIIQESSTLEEVLGKLSKTPIQIEPVVKADSATDALNNLVQQPVKDVIVGIKGDNTDANKKAEESKDKIDDVKQDTIPKIQVDNISANNRLKTTKQHLDEIKSKDVTVTVKTNYKTSGSPQINSISPDIQSVSTQSIERSMIENPNEIALLSDSSVRETVANTSVEQLNLKARAKNPISAMDSVTYSVDAFKKLEDQLKKISNELRIIGEKSESAFGSKKITYLKEQVKLYEQQQKIQHQLAEGMRSQANELKGYLQQKGIQISSDGQVLNYSQKMLAIEKELKSLSGSKNTAKTDELNKIKQALDDYINLTTNKIPGCSAEWWSLQNAIIQTNNEIIQLNVALKNVDPKILVGKFEASLNKVRREINRLDEDIDRAFGKKKEDLINKKISLLQKEQEELHKLANAYRQQANSMKDVLSGSGFTFDSSGMLTNYEHIKNLINDPNFSSISDILKEYIQLTQNTIPNLSEDWWDLQDSIDGCYEAIEAARKELEKFLEQAKVDTLLDEFNDLSHRLDIIDKKLKYATGKDKLDLMSEKLELINKQQIELQKHWQYFEEKKDSLQNELGNLGFTFDDDGDISNYVEQLEKLGNSSSDFDAIKEKLEEYFDLQNNKLPEIENDWLDFENAYKDALKEQLEITQQVEDKITKLYKKQVQDRIDAMNKETNEKVKNLNKQKDAYNKYRDEVEYKNSFEEKMSEIDDIQAQLDKAMRDTSLQGQKKVKELQKLLANAQKELDKITQDKIDSDINDMFDEETDRIQEENKNAIEELEKMWSDSKIAEMVSEAITSGIFEGIDGTIISLEDALVNFAKDSGELFGVMGDIVKSELLTNLDIAKDTLKELSEIMSNFDISSFASSIKMPSLDISSFGLNSGLSSSVIFDAPLINIEGNVDSGVVEDLKSFGDKLSKDIIQKISKAIR